MYPLKVISFYTPDWDYPKYADLLKKDCDRLGLDHYIVEKPSTNSYVGNCQIKAFFIRDSLEQFKCPILWIDADGSLLKSPDLLIDQNMAQFDIAGNHPVGSPHRVHVGSLWFNYTDAAKKFIDVWCTSIEQKKPLDDAAFNGTWDRMKNDIKFFTLPPSYFCILRNPGEANIPGDAHIVHRLSCSDLKLAYKKAVEGK